MASDQEDSKEQGAQTTAPYVRWVARRPIEVPIVDLPEGWTRPRPTKLPRSTYWPAVLAFAVVLIVWGPVFTWASTGLGVLLSIFALRGWIRELLRNEDEG